MNCPFTMLTVDVSRRFNYQITDSDEQLFKKGEKMWVQIKLNRFERSNKFIHFQFIQKYRKVNQKQ